MGFFSNALFKPALERSRSRLLTPDVRPVGYMCQCGRRSSEHENGTGKGKGLFSKCQKFERAQRIDFAFLRLG